MGKENNTRNAILEYYDECVTNNVCGDITIDTVFLIFRIVIQETACKIKEIGYVSNLFTWLKQKKEHRLVGIKEAINEVLYLYFSCRCINPKEYTFPDYSDFTCDNDKYIELKEKSISDNMRMYKLRCLCYAVASNIVDFTENLDESVIKQCNYYLSLPSAKRHKGIYLEFFKILSLYVFDEYNKFKIKYKI